MRTFALAASLTFASPAMAQQGPQLVEVITITAELGEVVQVGETVRGTRRIIPITGGKVEGEALTGTVRPGAWDWQIDRPDGCTELEADYFIETDDGALINVNNRAAICRDENGQMQPVFTRPVFEPPVGKYQWLGQGVFVGRLGPAVGHAGPAVRITIYRVE